MYDPAESVMFAFQADIMGKSVVPMQWNLQSGEASAIYRVRNSEERRAFPQAIHVP